MRYVADLVVGQVHRHCIGQVADAVAARGTVTGEEDAARPGSEQAA